MKTNPKLQAPGPALRAPSESGIFNPRRFPAPLSGGLCLVGALLVMLSFAEAARASGPGVSSSSVAEVPEAYARGQGIGLVLGFDAHTNVWFAHGVWKNSPAEQAGIPVGARVLSIGGSALPVGASANEPSALTEIKWRVAAAAFVGSIALGWQDSGGALHNSQIRFEPMPDLYRKATVNGGPMPTECQVCVCGFGACSCGSPDPGEDGCMFCSPAPNLLCSCFGNCMGVGINPPPLSGVVSRMTHGADASAPTFDIDLPQSGPPGIECRSGGATGDYTMVFTFVNTVTSCGLAITSAGSVSSSPSMPNGNQCTVNLTGVANAQNVSVTLTGAADSAHNVGSVSSTMGVLVGDTTANGSVNSSDISETKAQSGTVADSSNFRTDVTVNGLINSSDISTVKSKSGTALP